MHDKSHVIIIIITILNNKLEISKIAVKKSDRICSGPKRYHYRPAALPWSQIYPLIYCSFHIFLTRLLSWEPVRVLSRIGKMDHVAKWRLFGIACCHGLFHSSHIVTFKYFVYYAIVNNHQLDVMLLNVII